MNKNTDGCIGIRILSPLTGTAVPLEEVPDPVFSQKIIGDGVASCLRTAIWSVPLTQRWFP